EPVGKDPPDGAILDYRLKAAVTGPVVLEILDGDGKPVRRFASDDKSEPVDPKALTISPEWARPPQMLSAKAGSHRFVWDLHYPPPEDGGERRSSFPIAAVYHDTPAEPRGPWAHPGRYVVKLTANGQTLTQPLTVTMDPRVKTPAEELRRQFALSMDCYEGQRQAAAARREVRALRAQLRERREKAGAGPVA